MQESGVVIHGISLNAVKEEYECALRSAIGGFDGGCGWAADPDPIQVRSGICSKLELCVNKVVGDIARAITPRASEKGKAIAQYPAIRCGHSGWQQSPAILTLKKARPANKKVTKFHECETCCSFKSR